MCPLGASGFGVASSQSPPVCGGCPPPSFVSGSKVSVTSGPSCEGFGGICLLAHGCFGDFSPQTGSGSGVCRVTCGVVRGRGGRVPPGMAAARPPCPSRVCCVAPASACQGFGTPVCFRSSLPSRGVRICWAAVGGSALSRPAADAGFCCRLSPWVPAVLCGCWAGGRETCKVGDSTI